jgi:hypothetical protein
VVGKLVALKAYREGKLTLPAGYTLEHGADALLLRRADGSVVAVFGVRGTTFSDVEKTAWHDHQEKSGNIA